MAESATWHRFCPLSLMVCKDGYLTPQGRYNRTLLCAAWQNERCAKFSEPLLTEIRYPKGKVIFVYPDGSTMTVHPEVERHNGTD